MALTMSAFVARVARRALEERHPLSCLFELTPSCNLRCHFCYVALDPYAGPYLSTAQVYHVLDQLAEGGVLEVGLTGGEICSRRDIIDIYLYARRKGFLVTLCTNATMMTERFAEVLAEQPPHAVEVSIYGADAEHYERTTRIPGSFARFVRGVELLQRAGVNLVLKHPASVFTADHVAAISAWCTERGIQHRFSFELDDRHTGDGDPSLYRIEPRRVKELEDWKHEARTGERRAGPLPECAVDVAGGADRLYQCRAGRTSLFVDARGDASHCVMDREPRFSLLTTSFAEVWRRIGEWVDQPLPADAPCSGCSLRSSCHNCPARARLATGSPYLKDTYYCDITHVEHGLPPATHPDYRRAARPVGACVG